jgi:hypothetical protein
VGYQFFECRTVTLECCCAGECVCHFEGQYDKPLQSIGKRHVNLVFITELIETCLGVGLCGRKGLNLWKAWYSATGSKVA